jgi:hypothetical protein
MQLKLRECGSPMGTDPPSHSEGPVDPTFRRTVLPVGEFKR